eukprot:5940104-Amphidinium_carterae.1
MGTQDKYNKITQKMLLLDLWHLGWCQWLLAFQLAEVAAVEDRGKCVNFRTVVRIVQECLKVASRVTMAQPKFIFTHSSCLSLSACSLELRAGFALFYPCFASERKRL